MGYKGARLRRPLALAAVVLAGGAIAQAAIPNSRTKVISTCYATSDGALRVIDREAGATCTTSERLLEFNQAGVRWRGTWSSTTAYAAGDGVAYLGGSYVAKAASPAGTLPTNTTFWNVLALRGATGPRGPAGITGGRTYVAPGDGLSTFRRNCEVHEVVRRTVSLSANSRLFLNADATYEGDPNNFGTAEARIQVLDIGDNILASLSSARAEVPAWSDRTVTVQGVAADSSGEPLALPAGKYVVRLMLMSHGYCNRDTRWKDPAHLTYLKLGDAD